MSELHNNAPTMPHHNPQGDSPNDMVAATATQSVIQSVDRVLRPDQDEPFVMTCGGLSRLRRKTA
ncbi:MAG: hypothetical protein QF471_05550 [Phycisphaerales bacterium]|nr:hypothetical protein [Phycisphaerales bacterium]